MIKKEQIKECEEQRLGRNKDTKVNLTYINSGKYRKKFNYISNNTKLSRMLYQIAKKSLIHRSGTKYEDMYWIDLDRLAIIARETDALCEKKITYSASTEKKIKQYKNLLTLHTHPDSFPPSIDDLNSNFYHNYVAGIVLCHNGKIYMYSANEEINKNYYELLVESYIKNGYNEDRAQVLALSEIQMNFDIDFKEVIAE